ncbi:MULTISPECIES: glycine--tRNA ligase subunit beta [unclassified Acidovorax]|uniref:glycine--tRNA ligase subunit beta n=1 Tax=unclassified Acidovorax TaxID=2684926 RepID=UPI0006FDD806|nr:MULTISPECIES: glycine--tRNA ligase subunit beta [unclassified Acidovorax]KRA13024.1 glycine--tRNA ligase subunit beta [Acidovorax sp. Root568]PIF19614.1 glycyl-tRNA synthetase beta chain [Acidovorax sp. 59]PKW01358.1 glycyl-tRNA synthetase beta chain [Acidovorax sp. 30]
MTTQNLLVELFVEELPPKALQKLGDAFATVLGDQLKALGLASAASVVTPFASPRRLAAHVTAVADKAADKAVQQKLMPVTVGLQADGNATPALLKKLQALGADVSNPAAAVAALKRAQDGKAEALFYDSVVPGATLAAGLQKALDEAIAKLPIPKVMSYQLETDCELPGWTSVNFVRPAHGLVALHGSTVVPVKALGLTAGNSTTGHRFEAAVSPVVLADADSYAATLKKDGAVIASFAERKAEIARQLAAAAAKVGNGARPIEDEALLDEVTALVERPNVVICQFEEQFLGVPQECLILTMKANQKYFPLLDAAGKLTNKFLVVSNISPEDTSFVTGGNERVVRPRLADAKFFFDQDRKKTLASRVEGLGKVVYHNKLGTQGERVERVRAIAKAIASQLGDAQLVQDADLAAQLAKTDLVTDMVGEFPELQGIMGGYYALNDGLGETVANAIEDHYKPRFAGDALPRNTAGVVVALADKLETLVGMFGIGNLPTGDRDPFALRRHALGVIRMLVEKDLPLDLSALLAGAVPAFGDKITDATPALADFIYDRLAGSLREQGYSAQEVDAVLALRPQRLALVEKQLAAVRAFAALPESPALAAANKRVGNILKKAEVEGPVDAHVNPNLLQEKAEQDLYAALQRFVPEANAQFDAGDYTASLQTLAVLRAPVDAFFDDVMVNAEQLDLRLNRQGLLKTLHEAMNRVADLSRLAA